MRITWLGHSSFELETPAGETILLDPWFEGNPKYPAGHTVSKADAILLSHGHGDHIGSAEALAKKHGAKVVGNYELYLWFQSRGVSNFGPMNKGGSQQVGSVKVTMVHALHSSGIEDGKGNVIYGGEAAGYVIQLADGRRAYFAGDTSVFSDMALIGEIYKPELCFLPIGDLFTMGPEEAAVAVRMLKPKKVIPMHWGTFPVLTGRPEQLAALIQGTGVEVWTLEPGVAVSW
ncbi:MAG: metal-dependent hydrolase [Bryobacteraceae bacterium]